LERGGKGGGRMRWGTNRKRKESLFPEKGEVKSKTFYRRGKRRVRKAGDFNSKD